MYNNIGEKIKALAKVLFWIIAIIYFILGVISTDETNGASLLLILVGIPVAWIATWFTYGFGELIEKVTEIADNTRHGKYNQNPYCQPTDPYHHATATDPNFASPATHKWRCERCGYMTSATPCHICGHAKGEPN